eukprot:3843804-Amphidinium_carterae.1
MLLLVSTCSGLSLRAHTYDGSCKHAHTRTHAHLRRRSPLCASAAVLAGGVIAGHMNAQVPMRADESRAYVLTTAGKHLLQSLCTAT